MNTESDTKSNTLLQSIRPPFAPLAMVFGIWILLRILFFVGFQWKDDYYYVHFALFWPGPPANHWEARYLFNALLRGSFTLFGYSEWTATLPSLLGSFLIWVSVLRITWHQWPNKTILISAALLMACLPIDVHSALVSPRVLGMGLFALGTAFFFIGETKRSLILSGFLYGLSFCVHLTMMYSIGAVLFISILFRFRKIMDFAILFFTLALTCCILDLGVYALWTGNPFHHVHCIQDAAIPMFDQDAPSRYWIDSEGHIQMDFFLNPLMQLFTSNKFGLLGLGLLLAMSRWKRLASASRILLLSAVLLWAWISFGSFTLTQYRPISIDFDNLRPLGFLLVLIAVGEIARIQNARSRILFVSFLTMTNLIILLLSGPWARQFDVSRELLNYAQSHPDAEFVADDLVLEHIALIRGFQPVANIWATPISGQLRFSAANKCTETDKSLLLMVNPMTAKSPTGQWIQDHRGQTLFQSPVLYRPLLYLMPDRFREKYSWTIQKPSAMICRLDTAP